MINEKSVRSPYALPLALPKSASASSWAAGRTRQTPLCHALPSPRMLAGEGAGAELPAVDWSEGVHKACDGAVPNSLSSRHTPNAHPSNGKGILGNVSHVCDALRREGARGLLRTQARNVPAALVAGGVMHLLPPMVGLGGRDA